MIGKLRRKFIATNMLLVSLVLLCVFMAQTYSAYRQATDLVYRAQLQALEWITHSFSPSFVFDRLQPDGAQPPQAPEERKPNEGQHRKRAQDFPGIPAFAVELDSGDQVISLQATPGVEVTQETAQAVVEEALALPNNRGSLPGQDLSYLRREENDRRFISFADNSSIGGDLQRQVLISLLMGAAALLAFYLISRFLARASVAPIEKAWDQQRQFVADASHELKTPITVILANADIVLAHPDAPVRDQAKWLTYIQDEAGRMKSLVDDLLFLAKSDAAKAPLHPTQIRLSEVVTGSILPFESVAFESGVDLRENVQPGLTVQGDEGQLRRLVVILLDNAVKYAGERGAVTVTLDKFQDRPRLNVHNTGPAIPPEHLPHLFERFYRADAARDRAQGGYGLGLSIAKSITEAHGGKLSVKSTAEAGTDFTVVFPKK